MTFYFGKTQISISFWFLTGLAMLSILDKNFIFLPLLCAVVLHESVHIVAMLYFGVHIRALRLRIYGAALDCDLSMRSPASCAVIYLCAPLLNLVLGCIYYLMDSTSIFSAINLCLGIFNLLPIPPLDGGNAVAMLCTSHCMTRNFFVIRLICLIPVGIAAAYLCVRQHNFTLLACVAYLLLVAFAPPASHL